MTDVRKLLGGIGIAALLSGSALAGGTPPPDTAKKGAAEAPKTSCSGGEKGKTSCSGGEKVKTADAEQTKSTDSAAKAKSGCSGGEKSAAKGGSSCGKGSCS